MRRGDEGATVTIDGTAGHEKVGVEPSGPDITLSFHGRFPGTSLALITAAGCVARATVDGSGEGRLRWTTTGAGARFARVEVRRQARFPAMVALANPVWLNTIQGNSPGAAVGESGVAADERQ